MTYIGRLYLIGEHDLTERKRHINRTVFFLYNFIAYLFDKAHIDSYNIIVEVKL